MNTHAGPRGRLTDAEIVPATDYGHRLRLGRCAPAEFFTGWPDDDEVRGERRRWLGTAAPHHEVLTPAAEAVLPEAITLAAQWLGREGPPATTASAALRWLGESLAPDVILLADPGDGLRMVAGSVCFPSSWAPETRVGLGLEAIHGVVPGLNAELGAAIEGFLRRLQPGTAWLRANWGFAATGERNQHPWRALRRLDPPFDPAETWWRLEHQALVRLPASGGILFGIRIEQHRLSEWSARGTLGPALGRQVRTMEPAMAAYKGLGGVQAELGAWLETSGASAGQKHF